MTLTAGRLLGALLIPALALAGCTVAHAPATAASHAATTTARPSAAAALSPEQRAEADAQVTWLPARTASQLVPGTATAMAELELCQPVIFAVGATELSNDTRTWTGPGVATLGVPFQGKALAAGVLKTAGSKWNLAAYTS